MKYILLFTILAAQLFALTPQEVDSKLKFYLKKKFTSYYPTMLIEKVKITPSQTIQDDSEIIRVYLPNNSIKRESGSFSAILKSKDKQKRVYFKYQLDAKVSVLKAVVDIKRHSPLSNSLFDKVTIRFTNFYDKPVLNLEGSESKTHIPQGKILIKRLVRKTPLVHRKDKLTAIVDSDGIQLSFPVTALEDGIIGESIRVKRESNKIFQAVILSASEVHIR